MWLERCFIPLEGKTRFVCSVFSFDNDLICFQGVSNMKAKIREGSFFQSWLPDIYHLYHNLLPNLCASSAIYNLCIF